MENPKFNMTDFERFVESSIQSVLKLVVDVASLESNYQIITIIHAIIAHLGSKVAVCLLFPPSPFLTTAIICYKLELYVAKLLEALASLWEIAERDESVTALMKNGIVRTLSIIAKVFIVTAN